MGKANTTVAELRAAMAKDWKRFHYVYETHDDADLGKLISRAGGTLLGALSEAEACTDLFNEMASDARGWGW